MLSIWIELEDLSCDFSFKPFVGPTLAPPSWSTFTLRCDPTATVEHVESNTRGRSAAEPSRLLRLPLASGTRLNPQPSSIHHGTRARPYKGLAWLALPCTPQETRGAADNPCWTRHPRSPRCHPSSQSTEMNASCRLPCKMPVRSVVFSLLQPIAAVTSSATAPTCSEKSSCGQMPRVVQDHLATLLPTDGSPASTLLVVHGGEQEGQRRATDAAAGSGRPRRETWEF